MSRDNRFAGVFAAIPDGVTAGGFVAVWSSPFVFGPLSVKLAMLTMLGEFFLVHATGFFTGFASERSVSQLQRIGILLGLSVFYVLMIGAYAWNYRSWSPLFSFGWLLLGKIIWVVQNPKPDDSSTDRQMLAWAGSVALFLGGVFLTCVADIPRWGITAALAPRYGLNSHGALWEAEPQRVVAFGVIYFGITFLVKLAIGLFDARKPRVPDGRAVRRFH